MYSSAVSEAPGTFEQKNLNTLPESAEVKEENKVRDAREKKSRMDKRPLNSCSESDFAAQNRQGGNNTMRSGEVKP